MSNRRRRTATRRAAHPERTSRPAATPHPTPSSRKQDERKRTVFEAEQRKLDRRRSLIGLLVIIPLAVSLLCGPAALPISVPGVCDLPREVWFGVFAAIVGAYAGTWIRMILERRKFTREMRSAT